MKLTLKLVSALMLGVVAVTAIHGYLAVVRETRVFEEQARADARRIGAALEEPVVEVWREAGSRGVSDFLGQAGQSRQTMRIRWVWFDARPGSPDCPAIPPEQLTAILLQQQAPIPVQAIGSGSYLHSYWPVAVDAQRRGGLEFSRPMVELEQKKRDLIRRTLLLTVSLVLVTGLITGVLGVRFVGRPLEALIAKTRRIGSGDLGGAIHLRTHDELSELAESLNRMCDQLARSQTRVDRETAARIAALEQLRHADRLKTVGRLASGIAHELGTPLNVVSGRAGLIASGKLSAEELVQSAGTIKAESEKMAGIIRQLLDFARRGTPRRAPVDLVRLARETNQLLAPLAEKQQVTLSLDEDSPAAVAPVDVDQMRQVLANLIVNAIQAMPRGGTVRIGIRWAHATPPEGCDAAEGEYFRLDVRDQGEGISAEDLRHVFEPFFTTKDVGKGTGLGLSIAHGIVREHGGWIEVASRPGEGSCFSVYLPGEPRT